MKKFWKFLSLLGLLVSIFSCSNDNATGINVSEDEDCCNEVQEYKTATLLKSLNLIGEYATTQENDVLKIYAKDSLSVGYNDVYWVVEKRSNHKIKHIKDFSIEGLQPLMTMGSMNNMQHSTPIGEVENLEDMPVKHGWFSFLMASDTVKHNRWTLSFNYTIRGVSGKLDNIELNVATGKNITLRSFKVDNKVYFLSLVNASELMVGVNDVKAYVSQKSDTLTNPYPLATEKFSIEAIPTMPDMGNHTSPDNKPLQSTAEGVYTGLLNLTMTGQWNIHLVVKDANGKVVAGENNDNSGYSSLFWTIYI